MLANLRSYITIFVTLLSSICYSQTTNFTDPTSTTGSKIPDLADNGRSPQITTDSSGRFVYAIWKGASPFPIQVAIGLKTFFPLTSMSIRRPK